MQSHAGSRSQSRSVAPLSRPGHVDSSRNAVVMRVAHADINDSDYFSRSHSYQHLPADPFHCDKEFHFPGSSNIDYLPLGSPLVTP